MNGIGRRIRLGQQPVEPYYNSEFMEWLREETRKAMEPKADDRPPPARP